AADDPEVAVGVDLGGVAHLVDIVAVFRPVGLDVALVLAVERPRHGRPGPPEREEAAALLDDRAVLLHHRGLDARERLGCGSGLGLGYAGERGDHDLARLRLPPRVDDRAALAAYDLVVPGPRARVDRLADRPEEPQRRQVVLRRVLVAPLDAGADGRRRGVEDRHLQVLHDLPPAVLVRVVGSALVEHGRRAVAKRAVDDVRVAGDPADVGGAP